MATDTTYNGWTNRATWAVNLWLSNEEPLYRATLVLVGSADAEGAVRRYVEDIAHPGMLSDLRGESFNTVNWGEIVSAWRED